MKIMDRLTDYNYAKPKLVINYGTAGSRKIKKKTLVDCTKFIQRDMDASKLGFNLGETPFDYISTIKFSEKGLSCGTGDNFVSESPKIKTDLVDMEAYDIAKICLIKKIDFKCFKYVSDKADENAGGTWKENINKGLEK